jgi:opacity protein-like surface antigen
MSGWNISVDYNFTARLGAALYLDWTTNGSSTRTDIGSAMAGPEIYPFGHRKVTLFVHALFGGGRFYFSSSCGCLGGNSDHFSQYDFAWAVGGGVDYTLRPNVGIRLGQFDFEQVHFDLQSFRMGPLPAQENWKYSAAILLRF